MGGIAQAGTDGQVVRLPSALIQPISADDVAAALADYTLGRPLNQIVEIAGPEALGIDEAVRRFLTATRDARRVITDAKAPYYGVTVSERSLIPDNADRLAPTLRRLARSARPCRGGHCLNRGWRLLRCDAADRRPVGFCHRGGIETVRPHIFDR